MLIFVVIIFLIAVSLVPLMFGIRIAMHSNCKDLKDKIIPFLKAYFEGKRQYAYFSIYFAFLTAIGGPSLLDNLKAHFEYQNESTKINVGFSSNLGISDFLAIILCLAATFVYYWAVVRPKCKTIDISQLKRFCEVVNNEFGFQPNDDWFVKITKKAIKDLGNRYDENRNYPYKNIEQVLACLKKDKTTLDFIESHFENVYETFIEYKRKEENGDTKKSLSTIITNIESIFDELRKSECTYASIKNIIEATENIHKLLLEELSNWYKQNPRTGSTYDLNKFIDALRDFQKMLSDTWVTSLRSNTVLVNGNGGVGKSHFLADVANKRIKAGDPTILCLGMHITSNTEPLLQILSHIDVGCKKETFLKALNDYGKRVVLIIDGINEGAGIPLWRNHLDSMINEIAQYENIQLIVSFRSSGSDNFLDTYAKESNLSVYTHEGFTDSPKAIEYVFQSFGLDFPSFPFFGELYSNPMFLILYCRSHELSGKSIIEENKWQIIKDYVKALNTNLSKEFGYLKDANLVEKCLMAITDKMIEQGKSAINLNVAQATVDGIVKSYTTKSPSFLQAIINEGLLMTYSNGQETEIFFGYETVGNMFIAYNLVNNYPVNEWMKRGLVYDMKVLSYLAPEKEGKELFEYVDPSKRLGIIREAFLPSCKWNPKKTKGGGAVVANLLKNKDYYFWFKLALETAYNADSYVNASALSHELLNMDFKERDAIWTTCISDELSGIALRLAHWGWGVSQKALAKIGDKEIALTCEALIWCLSSTNIKLRDITTKALVNILCNKTKILCELLIKFYDVDDLYISERLWAVAMGCSLNNRDKNEVATIAQTAYDFVFKNRDAKQHYLLRQYARYTIEYAENLGCNMTINKSYLVAPYNIHSTIPKFPSTDYIKSTYVEDYKTATDKECWAAKNCILDSMKTECSTLGAYGDFGRYVFQSYMREWNRDPELLSNWCLKIIFEEFGYCPKTFAQFDNSHQSYNRSNNKIERIGKKYQWIAMYKILAILDDAYKGERKVDDWMSSTEMRVRNIDPTIRLNPNIPRITNGNVIYKVPKHNFSKIQKNRKKWLAKYKDMPPIKDFLEIVDNEGNTWVNLFSYNTIKSHLSEQDSEGLRKELWAFIQAMFIERRDLKRIRKAIDKDGLQGRGATENQETYNLFYREFYWSQHYKEEIGNAEYIKREFSTGNRNSAGILVEPAYFVYQLESSMDGSYVDGCEFLMPSELLFKDLKLTYAEEEGCWDDENGKLACVDNSIYHGGAQALLIRKDLLLKYLAITDKILVWPILMERTLRAAVSEVTYAQAGGYAYLDRTGIIKSKFRSYEPTIKQELSQKVDKIQAKFRRFLVRHHIIKVSLPEYLNYLSSEDMEEDDD